MAYNGWTNYSTWRINLEIFDCFDISDYGLDLDDTSAVADFLKETAHDIVIVSTPDGLAKDYAQAFMQDVNWYEIATNMTADVL